MGHFLHIFTQRLEFSKFDKTFANTNLPPCCKPHHSGHRTHHPASPTVLQPLLTGPGLNQAQRNQAPCFLLGNRHMPWNAPLGLYFCPHHSFFSTACCTDVPVWLRAISASVTKDKIKAADYTLRWDYITGNALFDYCFSKYIFYLMKD